MIKGHAVIELKDMATGAVQRVEHDNMVTNGLKYCLTPWLGKFSYATGGNSPQIMTEESTEERKAKNRSMMNHLLGGIFLFQNNLEENINNVAFPRDNPLTGRASWDAYNGMDTYRGSYNERESGLQEDGSYRQVWDFATNQANGQISALALTTYKGGICGCGFKDWNYATETAINESPFFDLGQIKINRSGEGGRCSPFINPALNEIYYVADRFCLVYNAAHADRYLGNAGKLFLKKKKFPLSSLSPFYDYYNQYYSEDLEIEVPEEFAAYASDGTWGECRGRTSDNYLYIYKYTHKSSNTIKAGESFKILRIRKSNLSADTITLTNNTPDYITRELEFTDNFCFIRNLNSPYSTYRIKIPDNEITALENIIYGDPIRIGDYLYSMDNNSKKGYCIDPETLEMKHHPAFKLNDVSYTWNESTEKITPNVYLKFMRYTYSDEIAYDYAQIYISANTLMTINNLPSPVTKTAAQTMKVTYTIQETEQ